MNNQIKAVTLSLTLLLSTALGGGTQGSPTVQSTPLQGSSIQASTKGSRIDPQALDRFMVQEMENYGVPDVGLAIVENGKIVYVHGHGVRDARTRRPVDADTQFAIGSVTKSFTALGIMWLVEKGLVKLDAPVIRYIPEFRLKDPLATRTVTVRHLLTHTTGLARDDKGLSDPAYPFAQILADAARTPLLGKPGTVYSYSNVNAVLAGEIVRRVSGKSWEAYTRDAVLRPLGMTKTDFTQAAMQRTGNFAAPHALDILTGLKPTPFYVLGTRAAAGAINASPAEMAKYLQFQVGSGAPLVSRSSMIAMHTRFISNEDANVGGLIAQAVTQAAKAKGVTPPPSFVSNNGYAFYWGTEHFRGQPVVEHGGNTDGFTANVSMLPMHGSGVLMLTNNEHADYFIEAVRQHVLQLLTGTQPPLDTSANLQAQLKLLGVDNATHRAQLQAARTSKVSAQSLQAVAGSYTSAVGGSALQVKVVGGHSLNLKAELQGVGLDLQLLPVGNDQFLSNSQPAVGYLFRFATSGGKQTLSMVTASGTLPLGQRTPLKQK